MGSRGIGPNMGTYVACVIGSFLLGLAASMLYGKGHEGQVLLPVLGGGAMTVLGLGSSFLVRNPRVRLTLMSIGAFGVALFFSGFHS